MWEGSLADKVSMQESDKSEFILTEIFLVFNLLGYLYNHKEINKKAQL